MHPELLHICQQLHAKGLSPSVALLRAKATNSLPIPEAVKAMKQWNQLSDEDKELQDPMKAVPPPIIEAKRSTIESLEKRVLALENELTSIKAELKLFK